MKRFFCIASLVVLLFACGFLGYLLYRSNHKLKTEADKNTLLCEKMIFHTESLGEFQLPLDLVLKDEFGQTFPIEKVLGHKSKLVLRFTDTNAAQCTHLLPLMRTLSQKIGVNNIQLWTSSVKPYKAQEYSQQHRLDYAQYDVSTKQLNEKVERLNVPYFFIVNSENRTLYTFLSEEKLPELTELYFSHVVDHFKKNGLLTNRIQFEKTEMDLGEVKSGSTYVVDFPFSNKMVQPLVIYKVKTSCGCTIADWDKSPVKPNASGRIRVEYRAENRGAFTKSIRVSSNAENGLVELILKGNVI